MAVSVSKQISNASRSDTYMGFCVYKAAICLQQGKIDPSKLQENLHRVTEGGQNTILHLASAAGNLQSIQQILDIDRQSGFVNATNVTGSTALHEAAQNGHYEVVELLLRHGSLVDMQNNLKETPLFKACEGGNSDLVKILLKANPSKLLDKSSDGRTCLHAVVNGGDADLLEYLLTFYFENNLGRQRVDLLKEVDSKGNTVLHLAAWRNRLDMVTVLLDREPDLSYSVNNDKETAICVASKLGFLPIVEALVNCRPDSIEIASENRKNILHLAVELNQLKILKFLVENVDLSQLINQRDEAPPKDKVKLIHNEILRFPVEKLEISLLINQPDEGPSKDNTHGQEDGNQSGGDTPLHIAARNKNFFVVDSLLKVPGVNKNAVNSAGLTPLDIARENTEYHESYKTIEKLCTYPKRRKPFLFKAPATSLQKQKQAVKNVEAVFLERRNVELVVAALLATMTFTAIFTVPGGYLTDEKEDCVPGIFQFLNKTRVPACLQRNPTEGECVEGCLRMDPTKEDCAPGCFRLHKHLPKKECSRMENTTKDCGPGCFYTNWTNCVRVVFLKNSTKEDSYVLGMPVLIGYDSFKLFLIFDCVAFYLSLFVVLMWEMSTPLTTGDKMLFMCMTSVLLCTAFAFTAYGLMAAVYSALFSKKKFGWTVLGSSMFIVFCGTCAFFYMAAKFVVMKARFLSLCGVPRLLDDVAENIWVKAEAHGILDAVRSCENFFRRLISGDFKVCKKKSQTQKKGRSECSGGDKNLWPCSPSAAPEHV